LSYCRCNHKQSEHNTIVAMPLDTSTYILAHLRLDGRRWNELRRLQAQTSTQAAADGSSYFEMGNTKIICTVAGPQEKKGGGGGGRSQQDKASIEVEVNFAGFSGMDRKKRARSDKYVLVCTNFAST
jgi:exosome complex component RRP41